MENKYIRGHERNYHYGPKNNWRRWGWNRLLERTAGREKSQPILYLAGPQDLDRQIAVSKGVPAANLIAIDKDYENVVRIRKSGGIAIEADIVAALEAWPRQRPVAAVVADFCHGLEPDEAVGLHERLFRTPFHEAVVWANFQRGRDASSNRIRWELNFNMKLGTKNRARHFFAMRAALLGLAAAKNMEEGCATRFQQQLVSLTWQQLASRMEASLSAEFLSYRSRSTSGAKALTFDSVIYRVLRAGTPIPHQDQHLAFDAQFTPDLTVKHRVGAALAVRTARSR